MWPHRKDKATPPPIPTPPRSHRRAASRAAMPDIDDTVARWLLAEADQLDAEALANEQQADRLLSHAIEWRAVAAAKRALVLSLPAEAFPPPEPEPEPAYDEPQDLSRFNRTWQIPAPHTQDPGGCACQWWRGESCERCDVLTHPGSLWRADTAPVPAVNGDAR